MKKGLLGFLVLAVVVAALASTNAVYAQSDTTTAGASDSFYGRGNPGGRGGMMDGDSLGLLHDEMVAVYSEKLGLTVEEIETRLTNGETMADIALSQGLTIEEFQTLMVETRTLAIDQAVTAGTLTQTQAEWMKTRGSMMGSGFSGTRGANGTRGQMGTGTCTLVNP